MACILVVDDDRLLRGAVEVILKSEGHRVASARCGHDGMNRFRSDRFDLVACDIGMPNSEGLEMIREMRGLSAALPIIAFTDGGGAVNGVHAGLPRVAGRLGATEMLAKPFRRQELLALVRQCLRSEECA